jgi:hypothetical protein
MATTLLTLSKTSRAGSVTTTLVQADTVNGNSFVNDGATYLVLDNKAGTLPVTVTVAVVGKADIDLPISNRQYSLNAGDVVCAGPFDKPLYNAADETVSFQVTGALIVAALSILN